MLEQIAYEGMPLIQRQQTYFVVGDLGRLSASALYSDGDTEFRDGRIETVLPRFKGNGTVKVYINPFDFSGIAGFQKEGESHDEYKKRMQESGGVSLGGGIGAPSSGIAGGY